MPEVRPPLVPRQEETMRGVRVRSNHNTPTILMAEQEDQQNPHSLKAYPHVTILSQFSISSCENMDKVKCPRDGSEMRWISRLKIYFCDNDGYILSPHEAALNGLVETETSPISEASH